MRVRFIGGPADGRDIDVAEPLPCHMKVDERQPFDISELLVKNSNDLVPIRTHTYYLDRFCGERLYYHYQLAQADVVRLLIRRYPQPLHLS